MLFGVKGAHTDSVTLSPNQVVAWNLERMRNARGWSQEETAKRLAPLFGYQLTRAAWSKAERSRYGNPIRRFDADEIVALARLFDAKVCDFFMVPESHFERRRVLINSKPGVPDAKVTARPLQAIELTALSGNAILPAGAPNLVGMFRFLWNLALRFVADAVIGYLREEPQAVAALVNGTPAAIDSLRARIRSKNLSPAEEITMINKFMQAAGLAPEEGR